MSSSTTGSSFTHNIAQGPPKLFESPGLIRHGAYPNPKRLGYCHQTKQPSFEIEPSTSRKLLVLELNGILVLSEHSDQKRPSTYDARQGTDANELSTTQIDYLTAADAITVPTPPGATPCTTKKGRSRTTHLRPYMETFREFLTRSKEWLDVIVVSGANPDAVKAMIGEAFGVDLYDAVADFTEPAKTIVERRRSGGMVTAKGERELKVRQSMATGKARDMASFQALDLKLILTRNDLLDLGKEDYRTSPFCARFLPSYLPISLDLLLLLNP
jgi:hypothetical protein